LFDLHYDNAPTYGQGEDRRLVLQGLLTPLSPLLLISSARPHPIPFVRLESHGDTSEPDEQQCLVTCPGRITTGESNMEDQATTVGVNVGINKRTIGTFTWLADQGRPLPAPKTDRFNGTVRVRLNRDSWGNTKMSILFPWPNRAQEVAMKLKGDTASPARIERATTIDGQEIPRSLARLIDSNNDGREGGEAGNDDEWEIRLRSVRPGQVVEVVLALGSLQGERISLPTFEGGGVGQMIVELRGDGWTGMFFSSSRSR
jgi:hypothetical protein